MTDKINGQGFRPADAAGTRRTDAAKPAGSKIEASAPPTAAAADTVNLTRWGVMLSNVTESLQSSPIVDAERVRAIKDALASGSYEIDDQAVADKLLRFDRELIA